MRSCMGVALVAMTHQDLKLHPNTVTNATGNFSADVNSTVMMANHSVEDEFKTQGFFNALMLTPPVRIFLVFSTAFD